MAYKDVILVEEVRTVVAAVNTALAAKQFPHTVYYMYGHPKEINNRLQELSNSPTEGAKKFPLIILLTDIPIRKDIIGYYGSASMHFLICNLTEATYTSEQRTAINFVPVLHPIKATLIEAIGKHKQFTYPGELTYVETDCYYYGSEINSKNIFNDRIDAIDISNLQVNIKNIIC